jgi:hypothetical protein
MPKNYKHITMDERELIAKMHWEAKELSEIAKAIDQDKIQQANNADKVVNIFVRNTIETQPLIDRYRNVVPALVEDKKNQSG